MVHPERTSMVKMGGKPSSEVSIILAKLSKGVVDPDRLGVVSALMRAATGSDAIPRGL